MTQHETRPSPFYKGPALLWTVVTLLAFLLVEAAIFRSGWYLQFVEPNSSAGTAESYLYWLRKTTPAAVPEVVVVGDSRVAEGFSPLAAEKAASGALRFWSFGMPGSMPRAWYYVLRDADPTRRRFAAIVLALDHYDDEEPADSSEDRLIDLNFVIGRLRLTDCPDFAQSMQNPASVSKALSGCFLKGLALRKDLEELLLNVDARKKRAKDWRENGLGYVNGYEGADGDLRGLTADFPHHRIVFPPGINAQQRNSIQAMLMPEKVPQHGALTRYRRLWLGRLLDLYKDSPTKIVFLEMPRAPLPRPESRVPALFLTGAMQRPRVIALPSTTFRDLEQPELFEDGLHLNKPGRAQFSTRLGQLILPRVKGR